MSERLSGTPDYPIVLNLSDRLVVIVGAGPVGQRKLQGVLNAGARIRMIDPILPEETDNPQLEYLSRTFRAGDLQGAALVFACTSDPHINQSIAEAAENLSIWCCRSDRAEHSDFILPAVLQRGNLLLSVSTGGGSPALSALLRDKLAETVSDSWGIAVEIIAAIRRKWLTEPTEVQYNQEVLRNLMDRELIPLIAHKEIKKIDQLLLTRFGPGFSLDELQVQIGKGRP